MNFLLCKQLDSLFSFLAYRKLSHADTKIQYFKLLVWGHLVTSRKTQAVILGCFFTEEEQFNSMDRDGSGTLSFKEAGSKFKAWGSVAGGDGEIDLDEFSNFFNFYSLQKKLNSCHLRA